MRIFFTHALCYFYSLGKVRIYYLENPKLGLKQNKRKWRLVISGRPVSELHFISPTNEYMFYFHGKLTQKVPFLLEYLVNLPSTKSKDDREGFSVEIERKFLKYLSNCYLFEFKSSIHSLSSNLMLHAQRVWLAVFNHSLHSLRLWQISAELKCWIQAFEFQLT